MRGQYGAGLEKKALIIEIVKVLKNRGIPRKNPLGSSLAPGRSILRLLLLLKVLSNLSDFEDLSHDELDPPCWCLAKSLQSDPVHIQTRFYSRGCHSGIYVPVASMDFLQAPREYWAGEGIIFTTSLQHHCHTNSSHLFPHFS